jgi:phosphohistidine phosphatase
MKTLLIMRHGKSSWKDASLSDRERPLKKRGRKDSTRIGVLLKNSGLAPDIILCSPAQRARQTAEIVMDQLSFEGQIEYVDGFYMAEPEVFFRTMRSLPDVNRVMIIGHNPGLETLYQILTDEISSLPTAALAQINLPVDTWQQLNLDICGSVEHLWLPRELR